MSETMIEVQGVDPLLFRDGRPFGNEDGALSARSLPIPLPSTFAGFIRTHLGNKAGWNWAEDGPEKALQTEVRGPLLKRNGELVFAAPADALIYTRDNGGNQFKVMCLRPEKPAEGTGCNFPESSLQPLQVSDDVKPESGYNFWKWSDMEQWLSYTGGDEFALPSKIEGLLREERVHVAIEDGKGVSKEGDLFTVEYRSFLNVKSDHTTTTASEEWSLVSKIRTNEEVSLTGVGLLGGEKRVARVEELGVGNDFPKCPDRLNDSDKQNQKVRMILATPAMFTDGWKPGWLNGQLEGSPPGTPGVVLKLKAAAVKRREPVSGWDYKARGPKAVRWLVPAGSVYFFEVVSGSDDAWLADAWLKPVSDHPQDCADGFGLALWGVW
ncbi:MAG: type III-B CRISPR module-associated protein Cmr3 [Fimbriimonadia bacterium]|nr:type III-B CRISPR module-associated protein Cmr3 [Fimbriimonadia bacterium]